MATRHPKLTGHPQWAAIRQCWKALERIAAAPMGKQDQVDDLKQRHAEALAGLVADGDLEAALADEVGMAFAEAVAHVEGNMGLCYMAFPIEQGPRQDLQQQLWALQEMAGQSGIDPATTAQVQAALERDMAWLGQSRAGASPGELEAVTASPSTSEAAGLLVKLMLADDDEKGRAA
jgi:hypothetical protein